MELQEFIRFGHLTALNDSAYTYIEFEEVVEFDCLFDCLYCLRLGGVGSLRLLQLVYLLLDGGIVYLFE